MAGPAKATAHDLQEQREFELATLGYSDISASRPRGRPGQSASGYHVHYSVSDGTFETEQRDHVLQADVHGSLKSHPLPTAKRPKIRPSDLEDDFAAMDFHIQEQDPSQAAPPDVLDDSDPEEEDDEEDFDEEVQGDTGKRKRYNSSDNPMGEWKPWLHVFLEESLRRHGLGNATLDPTCCKCGVRMVCGDAGDANGTSLDSSNDTPSMSSTQATCTELYRCKDCGDFLECHRCSLERHAWSPLHVLQVWRDECWNRTSLLEMGLIYQVGHQGARCVYPEPTKRLMTVMHVNGLHTVKYQFCSCDISDYEHKWQQLLRNGWYPASMTYPATCVTMDVLDHFRRLQVIATVNVRDFVTVLEKTTDPYGTEYTPDRYKVFGRVQRQFKFLKRARRSGVAHDPGGLLKAKPASLVVECWACPRLGVNLPSDWETVDEKYRYRYRRMYSVDANFRMNCKMRPEPRPDLPLFDGLGVQMPTEMYHTWLRQYVTEEDISSCISFAALMQKDTRFSVGLRWSGVLGVICARHEIMLGLGDLQKGERFKNTDFVLYTVLSRMGLKELTVTYDIACQYKKHFFERIKALPAALQDLMLETPVIQWALPVWHGNVHEVKCEAAESLKYKVGVGKTDGEGIERVWSVLNPFSYMTKEELPGARHDDIEDKLNYHNFTKNVGLGYTLLRRLKIALEERARQVASFDDVNRALQSDLREDWTQMVLEWIADNTKPNPYAPSGKMKISEAEVRRDLQKQEAEEEAADLQAEDNAEDEEESREQQQRSSAKGGHKGKRKAQRNSTRISPTGFLVLGLQIQDGQRRMNLDKTSSANATTAQETKIHQRRRVILAKIKEFRKWQEKYMPGVARILEDEEDERRDKALPAPLPEETKLWLPSDCALTHRKRSKCSERLFDSEAALRKGQCADALARLRSRLLAQRYMVNYRNAESRGQKATTRASKLLEGIGIKIKESAKKYRDGRGALVCLVGEKGCGSYLVLEDADIKVYKTEENDAEAVKKLGRLDGRDSKVTGTGREKKQDQKQDQKLEKQQPKKKKTKRRDEKGETRATMSWIWTADGGPDATDDAYLHECVRIEWAKALARKTRWAEEVEILKEEMRRVLRTLAWETTQWLQRAEMRSIGLSTAELGGRRAYALGQAKARLRIRVHFEKLWLASKPARGRKAGPMDSAALAETMVLVDEERANEHSLV